MKRYLKKITLAAAAMIATGCIWAQDSPGNLVYNEIDDSPVAGNHVLFPYIRHDTRNPRID